MTPLLQTLLLDRDQSPPAELQQYHMKFRFYYQVPYTQPPRMRTSSCLVTADVRARHALQPRLPPQPAADVDAGDGVAKVLHIIRKTEDLGVKIKR